MEVINNIIYTCKHKIAFIKTEKKLLGYNTLRGYMHDIDKIFLYLVLPKKLVSKLHRKWSKHHLDGSIRTTQELVRAIIDWECARFTKADKQLNAREAFNRYYADDVNREEIKSLLTFLGL